MRFRNSASKPMLSQRASGCILVPSSTRSRDRAPMSSTAVCSNSFATATPTPSTTLRPRQDSLKRNQYGGTYRRTHPPETACSGSSGLQQTSTRTAPPSSFAFVPTAAALSGDFSELEGAGCQTSGTARTLIDPQTGQPFAGNQISPSRFNPQALNLLKYIPVATDPCGKIVYSLPEPQSERQIVGRADSNLNAKNSHLRAHIPCQLQQSRARSANPTYS